MSVPENEGCVPAPGAAGIREASHLEGGAQVWDSGKTVENNWNQREPAFENAVIAVGRGKDNDGGWTGGLEPGDENHHTPLESPFSIL